MRAPARTSMCAAHTFILVGYGPAGTKTRKSCRAMVRPSLERVLGPAGTTFIADTWGIHKGRAAQTRPRLNFQVTYSILAGAQM